jgi:hypothetical protein
MYQLVSPLNGLPRNGWDSFPDRWRVHDIQPNSDENIDGDAFDDRRSTVDRAYRILILKDLL